MHLIILLEVCPRWVQSTLALQTAHNYGLSLLWNYGHFCGTNLTVKYFIVLTLNQADTMNFACDINCNLMFVICQNRVQRLLECFNICTTDSAFSLLHLFLPDSLGKTKPSSFILNDCLAVSLLLICLSSLTRYFGSPYNS